MNPFIKRRWFALTTFAILLTTCLVSVYIVADPSEYCVAQQRYISDQEFIQTSLALLEFERHQDKLRWNTNPKLYENYIKSYEILQKTRKRDGFIEVDRSGTHSIFSRLLSYQQIQVILNANSGDG